MVAVCLKLKFWNSHEVSQKTTKHVRQEVAIIKYGKVIPEYNFRVLPLHQPAWLYILENPTGIRHSHSSPIVFDSVHTTDLHHPIPVNHASYFMNHPV